MNAKLRKCNKFKLELKCNAKTYKQIYKNYNKTARFTCKLKNDKVQA